MDSWSNPAYRPSEVSKNDHSGPRWMETPDTGLSRGGRDEPGEWCILTVISHFISGADYDNKPSKGFQSKIRPGPFDQDKLGQCRIGLQTNQKGKFQLSPGTHAVIPKDGDTGHACSS